MRSTIRVLLILATLGCARTEQPVPAADSVPTSTPPAAPAAQVTITERDWVLAALGERSNPMGNGDRPPTLRLESATARASGFAGCNRFSGPYTLGADSLSFGALASTKMACAQGNDVEVAYLAALAEVRTFTATDSVLTLLGNGAAVATFRAQ
jgi:heat shock protein HslJ